MQGKIATENQEQRAVVKWLSLHPVLKKYYCKNNNEGKRSESQGWNLKMMGLRPGVSDLLIYYPANGFHGLWVEMKQARNYSPSEMITDSWIAQQEFIYIVREVGYAAEFCYGADHAINFIEMYLNGQLGKKRTV